MKGLKIRTKEKNSNRLASCPGIDLSGCKDKEEVRCRLFSPSSAWTWQEPALFVRRIVKRDCEEKSISTGKPAPTNLCICSFGFAHCSLLSSAFWLLSLLVIPGRGLRVGEREPNSNFRKGSRARGAGSNSMLVVCCCWPSKFWESPPGVSFPLFLLISLYLPSASRSRCYHLVLWVSLSLSFPTLFEQVKSRLEHDSLVGLC